MESKALNILLADDDENDRILFTEAFSALKLKTEVHTVNNGVQLMEWLGKKGNPMPQLIFIDLNMPKKDGLECLVEIKSNERLRDIFIAIFSTSDNEKDVEETFKNGANIYIIKPNDFKQLIQVLQKAVLTVNQYTDETMSRENFLMRIE